MIDYAYCIARKKMSRNYSFLYHIYDHSIDELREIKDFIEYSHEYIDIVVSQNSIIKNIDIIIEIFGNIYKALKSYKNEYGDFIDLDDEKRFHACLAYHAIRQIINEDDIIKNIDLLKDN